MTQLYAVGVIPAPRLLGIRAGDLLGTSFHAGTALTRIFSSDSMALTTMVIGEPRTKQNSSAEEARTLRVAIEHRSGLTRQEIASLLGVDRRSLSAWCSGETTPTDGNLQRLRRLYSLVNTLVGAGVQDVAVTMRDPEAAGEVAAAVRHGDLAHAVRAVTHGDLTTAPSEPITLTLTPEQWDAVRTLLEASSTAVPEAIIEEPGADLDEGGDAPAPTRILLDRSRYGGGSTMRKQRPSRR